MRTFDFYEFTGILVPGAITVVAVLLLFPHISTANFSTTNFSVGDLGLFVVLSYAAGHLTQAIGNGIEWLLWKTQGGRPTDWVRTKAHLLLADTQIHTLQAKLSSDLNIQSVIDKTMPLEDWSDITSRIHTAVSAQSENSRVDTFNGNYGLNRGIASALLIGLILLLVLHGLLYWQIAILVFFGAGVALYRMYHFGTLYARELFIQFIQLPGKGNTTTTSTPGQGQ